MVTTRATSRANSVEPGPFVPQTPSAKRTKSVSTKSTKASGSGSFAHVPTTITLAWLIFSLPLIVWDTGYVLLRPYSMPGGSLHAPLWVPYKLYGEVDLIYGFKAYNANNGFTGAQSFLNVIETLFYLWYAAAWYFSSTRSSAGVKVLSGRSGAKVTLLGFSAAVMTLSKTILYWASEYYCDFDNIGHNSLENLILIWIIPNGAWLVGSTYMIWSIGGDLVSSLNPPSRSKSE